MTDTYRPTKIWSLLTVACFAFVVLFEVFAILVAIGQVMNPESMIDIDTGETMSVWILVQSTLALVYAPVALATIVFFLIWLNKSYKNLAALRPNYLQFSSGWAVGYWFVPFLALWKPFQVVREVWWESDPEIPEGQMFLTESLHSAPTYMGVWWAFWIASNIANNIAGRAYEADTPDEVLIGGIIWIVASLLSIVAAILAAAVVREISARQAARLLSVRELEDKEARLKYEQAPSSPWSPEDLPQQNA